jgi:hypothetical protein
LREAGLCDEQLNWTGGSNTLWLIGDFFDRGESGLECIDITMKIQSQASLVGGSVQSLLGNHEMMILCAYRFKDSMTSEGILRFPMPEMLPQNRLLLHGVMQVGPVSTLMEEFIWEVPDLSTNLLSANL